MMAAATYAVDKQMTLFAELGERFLRVNLKTDSPEQTKRALELIGQEEEMRGELSKMGRDALAHYKRLAEDMKPAIPGEIIQLVEELAVMTATLRSPVLRDRKHIVTTAVVPEVGTRLGKQLSRITQAHALLWEKKSADRIDYTFTVRAAIDSIPVLRVKALRILSDGECTGKKLAALLSGSPSTVSYGMQDLEELGIVEKMSGHKGWRLNDSAHEVLKRTGMVGAIRQEESTKESIQA
jgi:DNA-binding transcriptional ArsR family regulator